MKMANKDNRYANVQQKAENFLKQNDFHKLPVDLDAIAKMLDITINPKPSNVEGVSGMLLKQGDNFGIMYATHIDNIGFQRFSIAHEIGHYLLEGHIEQILPDGNGIHVSQSGFTSQDPYEKEADNFACALLMPSELFKAEINKRGEGLAAIKGLKELCKTSFIATAIRYTEFAEEPCAVIVSTGDSVDYSFKSEALKKLPDIEWISKGNPIPSGTLTESFNKQNTNTTEEGSDSGILSDWVGEIGRAHV